MALGSKLTGTDLVWAGSGRSLGRRGTCKTGASVDVIDDRQPDDKVCSCL